MRITSIVIIKNIIVKLGNISALRCFEMHNFPPLFSYFAHYPQVKGESVSHWVVSDSLQLHGYSPPGSSVHGVLQARILEWLAISLSKGSSWLGDRTWGSCIVGRFFTVWATREANYPQNTTRRTVRLPDHLLFKILTTYVMEPADVCSETVWYFKNLCVKDCRDSPLVKTMPSIAEGLIPVWGAKIHVPPSQKTKT